MDNNKYDIKSKERLTRIISTKIKTAFIGALSAFEQSEFMELARQDRHLFRAYQNLRSKILNLGNEQIREVEKEIGAYEVKLGRHYYKMPVLKTQEEYLAYKRGLKDAQE